MSSLDQAFIKAYQDDQAASAAKIAAPAKPVRQPPVSPEPEGRRRSAVPRVPRKPILDLEAAPPAVVTPPVAPPSTTYARPPATNRSSLSKYDNEIPAAVVEAFAAQAVPPPPTQTVKRPTMPPVVPAPHARSFFHAEPPTVQPPRGRQWQRVDQIGIPEPPRELPPRVAEVQEIPVERLPVERSTVERPLERPAILPLSAYKQPTLREGPFKAAFEVDRFAWPATCESLLARANHRFASLGDELVELSKAGHKVVCVTGCQRGEGRTTLALCLAKTVAARGLKTVLVDADFTNPQLGRSLGLAVTTGWEAVLAGELPLTETLIESVGDRLSVLPLAKRPVGAAAFGRTLRGATALGVLRQNFDLVLLDAGPLGDQDDSGTTLLRHADRIDGVILLRDVRTADEDTIAAAEARLLALRTPCYGVAENFCA